MDFLFASESLNLVVMELQSKSLVIPPTIDVRKKIKYSLLLFINFGTIRFQHDKEVDRFRSCIANRIKQLRSFLDQQHTRPPAALQQTLLPTPYFTPILLRHPYVHPTLQYPMGSTPHVGQATTQWGSSFNGGPLPPPQLVYYPQYYAQMNYPLPTMPPPQNNSFQNTGQKPNLS